MKKVVYSFVVIALIGTGIAYANGVTPRQAVLYYSGHTHEDGGTQGAPSHSGGTNSAGCHNGSVPYHCH